MISREQLRAQYRANLRASMLHGFGPYLDSVVINSHPEPARFAEVAEWWQWEIIRAKYNSVQELAGFLPYDPNRQHSFLSVLPRGHDKSSLEGRIANFLLCFSKRKIQGYIVAADKDQGQLVLKAMEEEADRNPWFRPLLTFTKKEASGPAGSFEVVPADKGSAFGFRGNAYILDEVTHWPDASGDGVWSAIVSGREKIPGTLLVGITNAGVLGSWQHELLVKAAKNDPQEWYVFDNDGRPGQLASWMTPERVAKIAKQIPKIEADRVLYNKWVDLAVASEFLDPLDILLSVQPNATPHLKAQPGYNYCVGVDYAPYRDRTVLCVCHLDVLRNVVVDRFVVLRGDKSKGLAGEVQLADVEAEMEKLKGSYNPKAWSIDPYQMLNTCQKYEKKNWNIVRVEPRGGAAAKKMAQFLRSLIADHKLYIHPTVNTCEGIESFTDELKSLVTVYNRFGYRFTNTKDSHDDRAVTVSTAGEQCLLYPPKPRNSESPAPVEPTPRDSGNPLIKYSFGKK